MDSLLIDLWFLEGSIRSQPPTVQGMYFHCCRRLLVPVKGDDMKVKHVLFLYRSVLHWSNMLWQLFRIDSTLSLFVGGIAPFDIITSGCNKPLAVSRSGKAVNVTWNHIPPLTPRSDIYIEPCSGGMVEVALWRAIANLRCIPPLVTFVLLLTCVSGFTQTSLYGVPSFNQASEWIVFVIPACMQFLLGDYISRKKTYLVKLAPENPIRLSWLASCLDTLEITMDLL